MEDRQQAMQHNFDHHVPDIVQAKDICRNYMAAVLFAEVAFGKKPIFPHFTPGTFPMISYDGKAAEV